MDRVEAVPVPIKGRAGYNIRVNDPEATVQDYIDAIEHFIEDNVCFRSRMPELGSCFGCELCCQERIPVTLIDTFNLTGESLRETDTGLRKTIEESLHVFVDERVVDITLGLDDSGRCRFLDSEKKICRSYHRRPLVCRTFICCPSTRTAKELRAAIVNSGEDELVRKWFKLKDRNGSLIINEASCPRPMVSDYTKTPFYGAVEYRQVKLKDICSPLLWSQLVISAKSEKKKKVSD
ncbi:MAG: YkgJ family cysteine cluster protein [Firmicutes bacterium]|nr:YkgJ family cysteine cluster protein [Bacillota bacterium]